MIFVNNGIPYLRTKHAVETTTIDNEKQALNCKKNGKCQCFLLYCAESIFGYQLHYAISSQKIAADKFMGGGNNMGNI